MNTDAPNRAHDRISGLLNKLPRTARGHTVAVIGEFLGTLSFIFFAFAGTQTANVASNTNTGTTVITTTVQKNPAQLLYISLSFGFSLAVNAWVFFRISGGLFNPAVTLGMFMIGAITFVRAVLLVIAQLVGAIVGAYLVQALFTGGLNVSTTLSATTSVGQGIVIEMLLTCLLVFTIFMLAAEKHTGNFIAPVGIGLALFIAELVGVFWTGGSLNPARSFAPAVAIRSFKSTQWVYWVGPILGTFLAVIIYKIIKALEYETANPDPESAAPSGPAGDPEAIAEQKRYETSIAQGGVNGQSNARNGSYNMTNGSMSMREPNVGREADLEKGDGGSGGVMGIVHGGRSQPRGILPDGQHDAGQHRPGVKQSATGSYNNGSYRTPATTFGTGPAMRPVQEAGAQRDYATVDGPYRP